MRSDKEILQLIIDKAVLDQRIRAVLLNGSRVDPNVSPDSFQDFDIVYIVKEMETFTNDHKWTSYFGEKLIEQLPTTMSLYDEDKYQQNFSFTYLMLFSDSNRIDLTLYPLSRINEFKFERLTKVLIDKDELFSDQKFYSKEHHLINCPSEKEFLDVCNEFWWVSTYVAKGLARNEITYAKECMENVVRPMFMKMIAWYIGSKTNFSVSFGKAGRFIQKHISAPMYSKILATYSNSDPRENWKALFITTDLFADIAVEVAASLSFSYNSLEEQNVKAYLVQVKSKYQESA